MDILKFELICPFIVDKEDLSFYFKSKHYIKTILFTKQNGIVDINSYICFI